jgi:hypothetical protein
MISNECSAMFIVDGQAVRLSFRPDDGTLRFLDASGDCLREGHCNLSWTDLLSNIRQFNQQKKGSQKRLVDLFMLANRET